MKEPASAVDLNRLAIFHEVAQLGSFSQAASKLRQPKSRVSRQIQALEDELGVQLIYRTTRQFQLTPAGEELLARSRPLLNELKSALESVATAAEEVAGRIRVTVPDDVGVELMGPWCHEFMESYPRVYIELHTGNQVVDLVRDSYDLAVRMGRLRDSSLWHKKVGVMSLACVISPERAARLNAGRVPAVEKLPFLAFGTAEPGTRVVNLTNGKDKRALTFTTAFAANNFFVLRAMAIRGAGVTMLPPFLAREPIERGQLVPVLKGWHSEGTSVQLVMPQQRDIPERLKRFVEFLAGKLGSVL